jgi:hypothetical protein
MVSHILLEPEVQAFAEAVGKSPFLRNLGPEKGRPGEPAAGGY